MEDIFITDPDYPDFTEHGNPPCSESDPDAFFSDEPLEGMLNRRTVYSYENEAKKTCSDCPYRLDCLNYAMKNPDLQGIWGGFTEKERTALRNGTRTTAIRFSNRRS